MASPNSLKDYEDAKLIIKSLKKHSVIKGDYCTEEQSVNLWNAALEIVTGQPIDAEIYDKS